MTYSMPSPESPSHHTRPSLVAGLQRGDEDRWHEFFRRYGPAIRGFALKAGLTETEADEVVQETCLGVARNVAEYCYDPARCRFKTWLLNLASWRVKNQFARRRRWDDRKQLAPLGELDPGEAVLPEPAGADAWGELWDEEWRATLLRTAWDNVRPNLSATQFQIFDLNVMKDWPAGDVARTLGVSLASVYLTKHRVSAALKAEIKRQEQREDGLLR